MVSAVPGNHSRFLHNLLASIRSKDRRENGRLFPILGRMECSNQHGTLAGSTITEAHRTALSADLETSSASTSSDALLCFTGLHPVREQA